MLICSEIATFAMDELLVSLAFTAATLGIASAAVRKDTNRKEAQFSSASHESGVVATI